MASDAAVRTRPTILVVEDEALIAMMVQEVLAAAGYATEWLCDPLRIAPNPDADAAVVDLGLGQGFDGREVVRLLRRSRPGMPVVVFTGFNGAAPQADLRGLGGPTVRLHKPHDLDEIPLRLAEILAQEEPRAAPARRKGDATATAAP